MPPIHEISDRDALKIELALQVEDPAGVEALDLADVILEVFSNRSPAQAELMRQSLWRWSQQWPRNSPPTKRSG